MRIVITGVPGTGKSSIAKVLAVMLGMEYISLAETAENNEVVEMKNKERLVDIKKLEAKIGDYFVNKDNYIVEGHLACETFIPADWVFVLRTHPDVLRKRLSARGYDKKKMDENIEAEVLDYCFQRVQAVYRWRPVEIDTSKGSAQDAAKKIANNIRYNRRVGDIVDYSSELKKKLGLK